MSGETRDGKCGNKGCGAQRFDHLADDEGLRLVCPDGSGRRFSWPRTPGRASASFSEAEIVVLDTLVAHAMGASGGVSKTNPVLVQIRRKTMAMRKKTTGMKTLVITVLLLTGCRFGEVPPTIVCSEQHSWSNYHLAHDSLSPVLVNRSSYSPDAASWNDLGTPIQLRTSGRGFTITIEEGGDEGSRFLGLATVRVGSGGHIRSATVTMNRALLDRYEPEVAYHVMCQEIGHLLGLDHQRGADDSCLDDCQGRGDGWLACLSSQQGTTPNAHDAEQLEAIYEHADVGSGEGPGCTGTLVVHMFKIPGEGDSHAH